MISWSTGQPTYGYARRSSRSTNDNSSDLFEKKNNMAGREASQTPTQGTTSTGIPPTTVPTSRTDPKLLTSRNMEIAGVSAAAGILCTVLIGLCIFCYLRRRQRRSEGYRQPRPRYKKAGFHEIVRYQGQNDRSRSRTGDIFISLSHHNPPPPFLFLGTSKTGKNKETDDDGS